MAQFEKLRKITGLLRRPRCARPEAIESTGNPVTKQVALGTWAIGIPTLAGPIWIKLLPTSLGASY